MNAVYTELKRAAERGIKNQIRKPNDFMNANGLLVCGNCKTPRQKIISVSDPTPLEPNRKFSFIAPVQCKCEEEATERLKKEKAAAAEMQKIQRLKKASLMDKKFEKASLRNFDTDKSNANIFKICKEYVDDFETNLQSGQGILFWGDVGRGKSYAAACIANALLEKKVPVVMTSFIELLSIIQADRQGEADVVSALDAAKLVVFDDLGAERSTDYALEKVYSIIDRRYRKCLPMIITTNLSIQDMAQEEDVRYKRIYNRLIEVCEPVQITGADRRVKEGSRRYKASQKKRAAENG